MTDNATEKLVTTWRKEAATTLSEHDNVGTHMSRAMVYAAHQKRLMADRLAAALAADANEEE